ncbi:Fungalysin metallopeptidase-domain-containing protein [Mycena vulgaris]|nr:Fungalysin metallopeptidase-domain-containing protein [Mycena vulgaris]
MSVWRVVAKWNSSLTSALRDIPRRRLVCLGREHQHSVRLLGAVRGWLRRLFAYRYGFTQDTFNFQFNNFDKGSAAEDPVTSGQPRMLKMFLFTTTMVCSGPPTRSCSNVVCSMWPGLDGALENDFVVHENMHGITNGLTDGGTAACLQSLEAGGFGGGLSDAMAECEKSRRMQRFATTLSAQAWGIRHKAYAASVLNRPRRQPPVSAGLLREVHSTICMMHSPRGTCEGNDADTRRLAVVGAC